MVSSGVTSGATDASDSEPLLSALELSAGSVSDEESVTGTSETEDCAAEISAAEDSAGDTVTSAVADESADVLLCVSDEDSVTGSDEVPADFPEALPQDAIAIMASPVSIIYISFFFT